MEKDMCPANASADSVVLCVGDSLFDLPPRIPCASAGVERRASRRFTVCLPIIVRIGSWEIPAYTQNFSNTGVYFYMNPADRGPMGKESDLIVDLPPELTLSPRRQIHCRVRTVRSELSRNRMLGIAALIEEYSVRP